MSKDDSTTLVGASSSSDFDSKEGTATTSSLTSHSKDDNGDVVYSAVLPLNSQQPQQGRTSTSTSTRIQQLLHPSTIPMIGGFMGGIVSTTLLLPLDIIKLRLQVTESTSTDPNRKYRNFRALRIVGGIMKYEGLAGLYQGLTPAVLGSSISWGGYFFFYENFKQLYVKYKSSNDTTESRNSSDDAIVRATVQLSSIDNFMLACMSGAIMVALTNPIWLIKTRMQLQMKRAQQQQISSTTGSKGKIPMIKPYDNMIDAVRTIIREEGGIKALYKGSGPALLLTSHGGVQFVVYEYLRKHYQQYFISQQQQNSHQSDGNGNHQLRPSGWGKLQQSAGYLTMGAIAKIAATTSTYPLQLIKARMQQRMNAIDLMDDNSVRIVQRDGDSYKTMKSTIRKIYINEGIGGFFKGCITNAIRVAPGAAITFVVYEEVTAMLKQRIVV